MARRDRTTGLPRARQRAPEAAHARRPLNERYLQMGIIAASIIGVLVVLGFFAYSVYETRVGIPNRAVLTVGDQTFSLKYYTERLGPFLQENANSQVSVAVLEENLLAKLEDEAITVILAEEAGLDLSDDAVTAFIAEQLGVPVGGSGSSFDTLYRSQLRTLGVSDSTYRRLKQAELADSLLREQIKEDIGTSGDQYTLRAILLPTEEAAIEVKARIEQGEDMGTIAQVESLDLESRQNDGILQPEPLPLFPDSLQEILPTSEPGDLIGPVLVGQNWWVARVEAIEERDYSDVQLSQLVQVELDSQLDAKRTELLAAGEIERSLDSDDIDWAEEHIHIPDTGA